MDDVALTVAAALAGYLVSTFPTADLVTRLATRGRVDIRAVGSGNPGGFNTMRSVGKAWGVLVILVDVLKGTAAALAGWAIGDTAGAYAGATAGIAGHIFPVWTGFRGGKGVATALGTMLPIGFAMGGAVIATWLLVLLVSGYSSLASIVTVLLTPLFTYLLKPEYTLPVSLLSCLILIRHHENITRLLKGEESRLWRRRGGDSPAEVVKMGDAEQKRDERDEK